jgi:hypothetical protein
LRVGLTARSDMIASKMEGQAQKKQKEALVVSQYKPL